MKTAYEQAVAAADGGSFAPATLEAALAMNLFGAEETEDLEALKEMRGQDNLFDV